MHDQNFHRDFRKARLIGAAALAACLALTGHARAEEKTDFRVAWSIYAGWMPWGYAADNGIVQNWADKHGIAIEVTQFNDYVESMNQFTQRIALMADPRTGEWLLWSDTAASPARLAAGLGIAAATALLLGTVIGMLPCLRASLAHSSPFCPWSRPWRCCRSCSSPWAWARPPRSA